MANPKRGEASFTVQRTDDSGTRSDTYTLRFSVNVLCSIEEATGQKLVELAERWGNEDISIKDMRTLVHAALRPNHPRMSVEEAGDLIDEVGIEGITAAFLTAWERSSMSAFTAAPGEDDRPNGEAPLEDPLTPAVTTGTTS